MFTKQEILEEKDKEYWNHEVEDMPLLDQMYSEYTCLESMDEYAEQVALSWDKWKEDNVIKKSSDEFIVIEKGKSMDELKIYNRKELYRYFIKIIYCNSL